MKEYTFSDTYGLAHVYRLFLTADAHFKKSNEVKATNLAAISMDRALTMDIYNIIPITFIVRGLERKTILLS